MTSTLRGKQGGTWQGPAADGTVHVKVDGAWQSPAFCKIKSGGVWRDTGYVGYPNPPSTPWVHSWGTGYTQVQAAWSYAADGGASIAHYEVQLLNEAGSLWASENSTDNISPLWTIGQDTKAQIRVRSVANNGLVTPWSTVLKPKTGHAETYNYGNVQRTRGWSSGRNYYTAAALNLMGPGVPTGVVCTRIHWELWAYGLDAQGWLCTWPPGIKVGGDRQIEIHVAHSEVDENWVWDHPNWPNPLDGYDGAGFPGDLQFWGNGGRVGVKPIGPTGGNDVGGWTGGTGVAGYITATGTEYYYNYEVVSTNAAVANGYW